MAEVDGLAEFYEVQSAYRQALASLPQTDDEVGMTDPRYLRAHKECADLLKRYRELQAVMIRHNLSVLGDVLDMFVTIVFKDEDSGEVVHHVSNMKLSEACANGAVSLIMTHVADDHLLASIVVEVHRDSTLLGEIDEEGIFHYFSPPDMVTALTWLIATELGKEMSLDGAGINARIAADQLMATTGSFVIHFVPVTTKIVPPRLKDLRKFSALRFAEVLWQIAQHLRQPQTATN